MFCIAVIVILAIASSHVVSLPYDPEQVVWNLNQNQTATDPMDYGGVWENHSMWALSLLFSTLTNGQPSIHRLTIGDFLFTL